MYLEKKQNQLDKLKEEFNKLKAMALISNPKKRIEMNNHIRPIGNIIEECKKMLTNAAKTKVKPTDSIEIGMEVTWSKLQGLVNEAIKKYKV